MWFLYRLQLVFGDVCCGKGDDAGDGDNDTGLGVNACHSSDNSLEWAVNDADGASGAVVYLLVGNGIGLGKTYLNQTDEVGHAVVGDSDGGSDAFRGLGTDEVHRGQTVLTEKAMDGVVSALDKEKVGTGWCQLPDFFLSYGHRAIFSGGEGTYTFALD